MTSLTNNRRWPPWRIEINVAYVWYHEINRVSGLSIHSWVMSYQHLAQLGISIKRKYKEWGFLGGLQKIWATTLFNIRAIDVVRGLHAFLFRGAVSAIKHSSLTWNDLGGDENGYPLSIPWPRFRQSHAIAFVNDLRQNEVHIHAALLFVSISYSTDIQHEPLQKMSTPIHDQTIAFVNSKFALFDRRTRLSYAIGITLKHGGPNSNPLFFSVAVVQVLIIHLCSTAVKDFSKFIRNRRSLFLEADLNDISFEFHDYNDIYK